MFLLLLYQVNDTVIKRRHSLCLHLEPSVSVSPSLSKKILKFSFFSSFNESLGATPDAWVDRLGLTEGLSECLFMMCDSECKGK